MYRVLKSVPSPTCRAPTSRNNPAISGGVLRTSHARDRGAHDRSAGQHTCGSAPDPTSAPPKGDGNPEYASRPGPWRRMRHLQTGSAGKGKAGVALPTHLTVAKGLSYLWMAFAVGGVAWGIAGPSPFSQATLERTFRGWGSWACGGCALASPVHGAILIPSTPVVLAGIGLFTDRVPWSSWYPSSACSHRPRSSTVFGGTRATIECSRRSMGST